MVKYTKVVSSLGRLLGVPKSLKGKCGLHRYPQRDYFDFMKDLARETFT